MDFVMVTAPKPPGTRGSISPSAAVLEIAPAHVLHGAVRLQGLASSPTPETQVRLACPYIMDAPSTTNAKILSDFLICFSKLLFFAIKCWLGNPIKGHEAGPKGIVSRGECEILTDRIKVARLNFSRTSVARIRNGISSLTCRDASFPHDQQ